MKKLLFLTCMLLCISLSGWAQDAPSISVTPDTLDVKWEGMKVAETERIFLTLTATDNWKIEYVDSCDSWIKICDEVGSQIDSSSENKFGENEPLSLTVDVSRNDGIDDRNGQVVFYIEDKEDATDTLTIIQEGRRGPAISIEPGSLEFDANEEEREILVKSNSKWKISTSSDDWIEFPNYIIDDVNEATPADGVKVTIKVKAYEDQPPRRGVVYFIAVDELGETLKNDEKDVTASLTVEQKGKPNISIGEKVWEPEADSAEKTVSVTSNRKWVVSTEVSTEESWITLSPESGEYSGDITISITANESREPRSGKVYFKAVDDADNVLASDTLTINQKGANPNIRIENVENNTLEFDAIEEEGKKVTVKSNSKWKVSGNKKWITLSIDEGVNNGEVTIRVANNEKTLKRTGYVVFTAVDDNGDPYKIEGKEVTCSLTVVQAGAPVKISIDKESLTFDPTPTEAQEVTVSTNTKNWEPKTENDWIDVEKNDSILSVSVKPYTTVGEDRTGMVTIIAFDTPDELKNPNGNTKDITITQKGIEPVLTITAPDLEGTKLPSEGLTATVTLETNMDWTATVSEDAEDWISVSSGAGNTSEGETATSSVTVKVSENTAVQERTGTITFDTKYGTKSITITQMAAMPTIVLTKEPNYTNVYHGDTVAVSFQLKNEKDEPLSEESMKEYAWRWNGQESTESTFTYKASNSSQETKNDSIVLVVTRAEDGKPISGRADFKVWPTPAPQILVDGNKVEAKDNIQVNKYQSETANLTVTPIGGNPDGWDYTWMESRWAGVQITDTLSKQATCTISYNENKNRYITLKVTNRLPAPDNANNWSQEYSFQITFEKDLDLPTITLVPSTSYRNLKDGDQVTVGFSLKDQKTGETIADTNDYDWQWEVDGVSQGNGKEATLTASNKNNNDGKDQVVKLKFWRKGKEAETRESSLVFTSWPKPDVTISSDPISPDQGGRIQLEREQRSTTLSVNAKGGYKSGWSYEWIEKNRNTLTGANYQVLYDDGKETVRDITLKVKNTTPEGEVWFEKTYEYTVSFEVEDDVPDLRTSFENDVERTKMYVLSGVTFTVDLKLFSNNKEIDPDDYKKYEWSWDNNNWKQNWREEITADSVNSITTITDTIFVRSRGSSLNARPNDFKYYVCPGLALKESWNKSLSDEKNPNNPLMESQAIREGNEFRLNTIPELTGGYDTPEFKVTIDGQDFELNGGVGTIPNIGTKEGKTVQMKFVALAKYEGILMKGGTLELDSIDMTIYHKPTTPTVLRVKGDGTSRTWIVDGADQLCLKKGDKNIELSGSKTANATWVVMKDQAYEGGESDYYSYRAYTSGDVTITSGKKQGGAGKPDEEWDGSTYGTATNVRITTSQVSGQYSINGMRTNQLVHGLNIIRMEDGTVKKVFKK